MHGMHGTMRQRQKDGRTQKLLDINIIYVPHVCMAKKMNTNELLLTDLETARLIR